MRVHIRLHTIDKTPCLVEYATRRAYQHLSRFGHHVAGVTARLSDVNGPKGGADKRCRLSVSGPRMGSVSLTETHRDAFACVDLALDRLAHVVGRRLERAREPVDLSAARSG